MSGPLLPKARAAWGEPMPDWVRTPAEECDASSLRQVAAKIGASPAMVSLAVNKRREKLDFIKAKVEARLMISMVACPVLGLMSRIACLQEQARGFSTANPLQVQLYRACRNGCPNYRGNLNKERRHAERRH